MWEKREKNGLIWFALPKWEKAGARVVMTTRVGGVSEEPFSALNLGLHVGDESADVIGNRRKLLGALDVREEDFVSVKQVHGKSILKAENIHRHCGFLSYDTAVDDTDGVFTMGKHLLMATFYADCLPIAVFHPEKKILGLAHAGWKGTFQNIGRELLTAMRKTADFALEDCWCALGAGIGSCCYEVDEAFFLRFKGAYDDAESWFFPGAEGKYRFDNVKANVDLLKQSGVKEENIDILGLCTACHNDLFFSYRKEHGHTGRHGLWGELI